MSRQQSLRVGAVEWCSVGRSNFAAEVARLCVLLRRDAPRRVAFVALDGEFSGPSWSSAVDAEHGAWRAVHARQIRGAGIWDANLARRFAALREATHANALLQLGLALYLDDGDGGYAVEAFNFSLLPRRDFGVSASSMAFLARNGIDLNAHFRNAVPLWLAPPLPPPGTERSAASAAAPRAPPPDPPPQSSPLTAEEKRVLRNRRSKERKRKRKRAQQPSQLGRTDAAAAAAAAAAELAAAAAAAAAREREKDGADERARRTQSAKRNTKKRRRKSSSAGASAAARPAAAPPAPSARVLLARALRLVGARAPLIVHNGLADLLFVSRTFDLCCAAAEDRACETTAAAAAAPAAALQAKEEAQRATEARPSPPSRATLPGTMEEWVGRTHALWGGEGAGVFDTKFMAASLDSGCHATWLKYVYMRSERVHGGGGARAPRGDGAEHPPPCHHFAQCGACARLKRGRVCDYDHDLERLLASEEARDNRSRTRRRRKRAPAASAAANHAAVAPAPRAPLLLQRDDWHTAAHDAVATGYIFASFLQRYGGGAEGVSPAAAARRHIPGFVPECVDDCRNRVHLMRRQRPGTEDAALLPLVLRPAVGRGSSLSPQQDATLTVGAVSPGPLLP